MFEEVVKNLYGRVDQKREENVQNPKGYLRLSILMYQNNLCLLLYPLTPSFDSS